LSQIMVELVRARVAAPSADGIQDGATLLSHPHIWCDRAHRLLPIVRPSCSRRLCE
jgi:hypothetical protein